MLHSVTWSGMQTMAGDYRHADIHRAQVRRTNRPAATIGTGDPVTRAAHLASTSRIARLITILPHAR